MLSCACGYFATKYMDNEHCLKIEFSNKEDANAVAVARDSLLKGKTGQNSKQLREFVI